MLPGASPECTFSLGPAGPNPVRCLRLFGPLRLRLLAAGRTEVRAPAGKALTPEVVRALKSPIERHSGWRLTK